MVTEVRYCLMNPTVFEFWRWFCLWRGQPGRIRAGRRRFLGTATATATAAVRRALGRSQECPPVSVAVGTAPGRFKICAPEGPVSAPCSRQSFVMHKAAFEALWQFSAASTRSMRANRHAASHPQPDEMPHHGEKTWHAAIKGAEGTRKNTHTHTASYSRSHNLT